MWISTILRDILFHGPIGLQDILNHQEWVITGIDAMAPTSLGVSIGLGHGEGIDFYVHTRIGEDGKRNVVAGPGASKKACRITIPSASALDPAGPTYIVVSLQISR